MKERFVVIDLETTGHSPENGDKIIQIGAVVISDGEIAETMSTLVNPNVPIPPFIQKLTHISNEMVKDAPEFREVVPELLKLLENSCFVAHNVSFDFSFLQHELQQLGYKKLTMPKIDTVELARIMLPTLESYKLTQMADYLEISHDRPHQADSDAYVTAELFLHLIEKLKKLPSHTLNQLLTLSKHLKSDLEYVLKPLLEKKNNHRSRSFLLYNELAMKKDEKVLLHKEENEPPSFAEFFPQLALKTDAFRRYEAREGQLQMMEEVYASFRDNYHLLIEAGTGTGKSLAYMLPAIFYAKEMGETVVVSTNTIVLQQQLKEETIPLIEEIVPFSFKVSLLKGRNHYLCLRKFNERMQTYAGDDYSTILTKAQILVWLTETTVGDVEQLNLPANKNVFWYDVRSDSETCLNHRCPWFSYCFYHKAKNEAKNSDVVITNHALLFTDELEDQQVIPSHAKVVIDEAHHLEDVASQFLGTELDYKSLTLLLNRFLHYNVSLIAKWNDDDKMAAEIEILKQNIDELFSLLHSYVLNKNGSNQSEVGRCTYTYVSPKEGGEWEKILRCCDETVIALETWIKKLQATVVQMEQVKDSRPSELNELKSFLKWLLQLKTDLETLLLEYDPRYVYWIEIEEKGAKNATYIYRRPIEIKDTLARQFFKKKESVVLTSATLAVKNDFQYMEERLGLIDMPVKAMSIPSPFEYEKQAKLYVPIDIANIKDGEEHFIADISEKIVEIARITDGRMLVLFTSFDMLKKTYERMKLLLEDDYFHLFAQGIYSSSRSKLIKSFKMNEKAILLGTSTFWEGVDIPGEQLSCLVIVRLPFTPPNDPVLLARSRQLKEAGKNPFMELALPQAVLRFKQGFGRLIRSPDDVGVAIVLDNRIITARYGSFFLQALPDVPLIANTTEGILAELSQFFKKERA